MYTMDKTFLASIILRQARVRKCSLILCRRVAYLKPLESLCMDVIFKNFSKYTIKAEQEAHLGLNDILWEQLLPHFLGNSYKISNHNYFIEKCDELVEFLALLLVSARHFDFRCVSGELRDYENTLWEALQKNENCLRSLIVLNHDDLCFIKPKLLCEVPRQLEIICSLRSLKTLYLSLGQILDEAALTSIGKNLLNLVSLNCTLAKEGIQKEAMDQFFSNLKYLKEFRCNSDFEHMKSLLEMNHKLQVAGIEASSKLLKNPLTEQEAGHCTNGLQNPIPLEHLVLYKESLGENQMKMLSSVKHLKLVGWQKDRQMNDTLWKNLLDFEYLDSLHFHNSNSIYLKFLEKFGPWLKGLSLVNVTYGATGTLPMDQILRLCPRLETLLIADAYNPKVQAGPPPLPPMKYLEKLAIVGNYSSEGKWVNTCEDFGPIGRLLIHLLSSPELKEVYLDRVSFSTIYTCCSQIIMTEDILELLASSGKIFQKLEHCYVFNGQLTPALVYAPKFQSHVQDILTRFV